MTERPGEPEEPGSPLRPDRPTRSSTPVDDLLAAAPGMARIAGNAVSHLTEWAISTTIGNGVSAYRALLAGEPTPKVIGDMVRRAREDTGSLLGTRPAVPGSSDDGRSSEPLRGTDDDLRTRGASLLRRSADVRYEDIVHPAYSRILDELAPDEARLLRTFYVEGAQPSVDVRTAGTIPTTSELVAPGITMVGSLAGCRYLDRVPRYLDNLQRLGLIWFSREPVGDLGRYHVLEAQPDVADALARSKRSKTVRRSIHLTPFGIDFCEVCLPVTPNGGVAEP